MDLEKIVAAFSILVSCLVSVLNWRLQRRLAKLEEDKFEVDAQKTNSEIMTTVVDTTRNLLEPLNREILELREELGIAQSRIKILEEERNGLASRLAQTEKALVAANQRIIQLETDLKTSIDYVVELTRQLIQLGVTPAVDISQIRTLGEK